MPALPDLRSAEERRGLGVWRRLASQLRRRALFIALVLVPTLLTAVYMFAIASDQYISEAHFVVRSATRPNVGGLGALLQGTGLSGIRDESYPVTDFLKSRDALREIVDDVKFRDVVARPGADFLARFPAFHQDDTFEELYEHYLKIVSVVHDPASGINTLKVRTFSAGDSQRVAEALLQVSERVVNRLNERALGDAVSLAEQQVEKAEKRSAAAQKALTEYRIAVGVVDTTASAKGFLELIGGLERELVQARAQLSQMQATSPNSPGAQSIRDRAAAIEQQIAAERRKLVGTDGALVGTFAEFARLTMDAEFAQKAVTATHAMLETARMETLRKQLYLERVVAPNAADLSRYPRRFLSVLTVFGTAMLVYAILWLVVANAREHAS
jgi:capsular polysaccharide transport system permease protein